MPGLGRRAAPDERDQRYLLREIVPVSTRLRRYWDMSRAWLDQTYKPHCVGYSWTHWIEDGPVYQPNVTGDSAYADALYYECQKIDEWPGEDYDGTSVRAGAKVLQGRGLIAEYYWAFDLDTVLDALLEAGPVVVGTDWYEAMSYPGEDRLLKTEGGIVGGHAYILNGVNRNGGWMRCKNSWGRDWAFKGHARIDFDTMAKLIEDNGEACLALETTA